MITCEVYLRKLLEEFVGRCLMRPKVKLLGEAYTKPDFPPDLEWFKICNELNENVGEILAAVEFLELPPSTEIEPESVKPKDVVPIPLDIKPTYRMYRIDVIYWGVRNLKKIYCMPITKPKIGVEICGSVLYSDTLINAKNNLNFTSTYKFMDVVLPDQEDFVPPISIKMFDCRSFGRNTFAGIHLIRVKPFLFQPLSKAQREQILEGFAAKSLETINTNDDVKSEHSISGMFSIIILIRIHFYSTVKCLNKCSFIV